MKLHLDKGGDNQNVINGYQAGQITINNTAHNTSLILTPNHINPAWPPQTYLELAPDHLQQLLEYDPEVVIIGTGNQLRFLQGGQTEPFVRANVGFEVMDTAAACRTFNVLMAEGRKVVAGLLLMS